MGIGLLLVQIGVGLWAGRALAEGEESRERQAVPDAPSQETALRTVKEVFGEGYGKTAAADRIALAKALRDEASKDKTDAATRYVLLSEARDVAGEAGDFTAALDAIAALDRQFKIDADEMRLAALKSWVKGLESPESRRGFVRACFVTGEKAAADGNYDVGVRAAAMAEPVARGLRDRALIGIIQGQSAECLKAQREVTRAKAAQQRLDAKKGTAEDYLAAGEYLCFRKGDWAKGLPLLAKGSNAALAALAAREATPPTTSEQQRALGEAWWDWAEKNRSVAKGQIRKHAAGYYRTALEGGLTGLARTQAEKRVAEASENENLLPESLGEPKWISKDATYTMSTEGNPPLLQPLPNLLNGIGGGAQNNGFAFHTKPVDSPYITIDLGATKRIASLEIVNRRDDLALLGRAKTLTVWTGATANGPWRELWRAAGAEKEWTIKLPAPVTARFVKIGLREKNPLHLFSVKVFGWDGH
jgi:hypothetical protein